MKERKIGIMGGTFNPVHLGHLMLAEKAREQFLLDEIWFMPLKNPPHKEKDNRITDEERVIMLQLAIETNSAFQISFLELKREGITYTVDTLRELSETKKNYAFYFILGADSLFQIETWREPDQIMKLSCLLVGGRDEIPHKTLQSQIEFLEEKYKGKIGLIDFPQIAISSQEIRELLKEKKSIKYLVPEPVYNFIMKEHLYQEEGGKRYD